MRLATRGKENVDYNGGILYDEKMKLKQLKHEDEELVSSIMGHGRNSGSGSKNMKLQQPDDLEEIFFGSNHKSSKRGNRESNLDRHSIVTNNKDIRTTEGCCNDDDIEGYDENTNCRLREETNASMMFGAAGVSAPINLSHVKIDVNG